METQAQQRTRDDAFLPTEDVETTPQWNLVTRIAFRLCFAYAILYTFHFLVRYVPYAGMLIREQELGFWRALVPWVGKHILRLNDVPIIRATGSGDTAFNYVQVFLFLLIAVCAMLVWSLLDRKRPSYPKLYAWLTLIVRLWLACLMLR